MADCPLRIAIVGAGPSGLFAAEALSTQSRAFEIVLLERLPTPFGLLRYGVAPDHFAMRNLRTNLERILDHPSVRFFGGVELGKDVSVAELRRCFDARIYAYGACRGQNLQVQGETLRGCLSASDFAAWYCGHPDAATAEVTAMVHSARRVAVIGAGNVAIDVARIFALSQAELAPTDMPDHVRQALASTRIREILVVSRRGPQAAKFTAKELRQLGQLKEADPLVRPVDFADADTTDHRLVAILRGWLGHASRPGTKRIRFLFHERPIRLVGNEQVDAVVLERTAEPDVHKQEEIAVDMVVTAIGYRGQPIPGLPYDETFGIIPTRHGRVWDGDGIVAGDYATGWIRRGATGVIGTNKADANDVVAALLSDFALVKAQGNKSDSLELLLRRRDRTIFDLAHWRRIDAAERALGAQRGAARTTIHDWDGLRQPDRAGVL